MKKTSLCLALCALGMVSAAHAAEPGVVCENQLPAYDKETLDPYRADKEQKLRPLPGYGYVLDGNGKRWTSADGTPIFHLADPYANCSPEELMAMGFVVMGASSDVGFGSGSSKDKR